MDDNFDIPDFTIRNVTLFIAFILLFGLYFVAGTVYIGNGYTPHVERILQVAGILTFATLFFGIMSSCSETNGEQDETEQEASSGNQESIG